MLHSHYSALLFIFFFFAQINAQNATKSHEFSNALGQSVKDQVVIYDQGDGSVVIDVSSLTKGVYTVKYGARVSSLVKN